MQEHPIVGCINLYNPIAVDFKVWLSSEHWIAVLISVGMFPRTRRLVVHIAANVNEFCKCSGKHCSLKSKLDFASHIDKLAGTAV